MKLCSRELLAGEKHSLVRMFKDKRENGDTMNSDEQKNRPGKEYAVRDAVIGRYRVDLEENGLLVLKHPAGICFDVTLDETLELLDFLSIHRSALLAIDRGQSRETDPVLRIVKKEEVE
jgi:hypothetical protein